MSEASLFSKGKVKSGRQKVDGPALDTPKG